ncbi:hypothetical protein AMECASPLE_038443 [Ameca splendens]|uniref:Uncharacterized protein n=1 Tax=Ameca splendens TaxID=208324 RepID=A0ABV0XXJ6_9TELE
MENSEFSTLFSFSLSDVPVVPALPFVPSPCAARTGPVKAGGLLYVLDHSRGTRQMRDAIDQLMAKHHGQKDFLTKVDAEYAVVVQTASRDPNSLLPLNSIYLAMLCETPG